MSPVIPVAVSESVIESGANSERRESCESAETRRAGAERREALDHDLVAQWLMANPAFFDTHADLLADIRLRHGHKGKAVSLIERQVSVLRDRNQTLEGRLEELIRFGQDNDALNTRLQRLYRELLRTVDPVRLPAVLEDGLRQIFSVPQVAIRLWPVGGGTMRQVPAARPVSAELQRTAAGLQRPYCGPSVFAEAADWLSSDSVDGAAVTTESVVLFALRTGDQPEAFGLVVMGSADAGRFQAGMGTAFLEQLAELASASLSRLQTA